MLVVVVITAKRTELNFGLGVSILKKRLGYIPAQLFSLKGEKMYMHLGIGSKERGRVIDLKLKTRNQHSIIL